MTIEGGGTDIVEAADEQNAVLQVPNGLSARIAQWRDIQAHENKEPEVKKVRTR